MIARRYISVLAMLALTLLSRTGLALAQPDGPVVLTISGKIDHMNAGQTAAFSMRMIEALPQQTFTTKTPWYPQPIEFTGPLLRDVLAGAGATGTRMTAIALNDYKTEILVSDAMQQTVILARLRDGKPMPVRGARILLAEDNELNQQVAVELLQDAGFMVDVAGDGQQALDAVSRAARAGVPYDVVLMDMQMPVMDGLTATMALRQDPDNDELPIVAMTANAMQPDRDRCTQAGMNDFVAKPVEPDDLWRALATWIKPRPGLPVDAPPGADFTARPPASVDPGGDVVPVKIPGLDTQLGLQRVMHKRPLYVRLLHMFASTRDGIVEEVTRALDAADWTTATRYAHTLKGVAGNIGASNLQAHAAELETALEGRASREAINNLLRTTGQLQNDLVLAIQAQLDSPKMADQPVANKRQLEAVCRQLAQLLDTNDASAGDLLEEHGNSLKSTFGDGYSAIERGVREFEFDAARAALAQCGARIGVVLT